MRTFKHYDHLFNWNCIFGFDGENQELKKDTGHFSLILKEVVDFVIFAVTVLLFSAIMFLF